LLRYNPEFFWLLLLPLQSTKHTPLRRRHRSSIQTTYHLPASPNHSFNFNNQTMRSGHFGKVVDLRDVPRNKMLVFEIQTNTTTMRKRNELLDQYREFKLPSSKTIRHPLTLGFQHFELRLIFTSIAFPSSSDLSTLACRLRSPTAASSRRLWRCPPASGSRLASFPATFGSPTSYK